MLTVKTVQRSGHDSDAGDGDADQVMMMRAMVLMCRGAVQMTVT